mmetsp:Transcript_24210/g.40565  ORF Transcript_24210/g.40565 Transcript_24210/m.40565 type:complete len:113 (+) Transcript_24210:141-479(+)
MIFGNKLKAKQAEETQDAGGAASKLQKGLKELNVLKPQLAAVTQSPISPPGPTDTVSVFEFGGPSKEVTVNGYCPVAGGSLEACEWSVATKGQKTNTTDAHFTTNPNFRIVF